MSTAAFVASQRTEFGIPHAVACRALRISESWFCRWRSGPPSARCVPRRADLDAAVRDCFEFSKGTYGSPRVHAQLRRDGRAVSRKSVEASMSRQGLAARRRKRRKGLTRAQRAAAAPQDLLGRDFTAAAPDRRWVGDFKEAPTAQGPGVPRHGDRSVLAPGGRVRDLGPPSHRRARRGRFEHGRRHPRRRRHRSDISHRQGLPIHRGGLRRRLRAPRRRPVHRTRRVRPGQRRRRVVLLRPRARTRRPSQLGHPLPGTPRHRRLDHRLVTICG